MKAAVLREICAPLEIENLEIDSPARGEILIRTVATGLCHSDLNLLDGKIPHPLPMVLGHEPAGIVEAVGEGVRDIEPGDHVLVAVVRYCGTCRFCAGGRNNLCLTAHEPRANGNTKPTMWDASGEPVGQFGPSSFAEKMLVGENAVTKIRKDIPLDRACLISCGVTTGLGAAMYTAQLRAGESVAVIGCGGVGLSAIQGARIVGAGRIIAIDAKPEKFELARLCGATDCIDASKDNPVEAVLDLTGGADVVLECIGIVPTAQQAVQMTGRGGTTVLVGIQSVSDVMSVNGADLTLQEKKITGTLMGSTRGQQDTLRFVDFYMDGRLLIDELVSARVGLEDINLAIDRMRKNEGTRQVVTFE